MAEEMVPRIVVSNDEDAEILFAALVGYIQSLSARLILIHGVDMHIVNAMHRATELSGILGEEIQGSNVRRLAGEIPDDLSGLDQENGD